MTERVDERDSYSSFRRWAGERGADPRKECDERSVGLSHQKPSRIARQIFTREKRTVVTYSEKYRAAVFIVEDAITNPTSPTVRGTTMWNDLSPVASECLRIRVNSSSHQSSGAYLVTANATKLANIQGGAQSKRVVVRPYPSVAVRVGKNALNEREMTKEVTLHAADK